MDIKKVIGVTLLSMAASAAFASKPPIKIGVPVGLSGANSVVAPSVVQSSKLAVKQINSSGGILGRKVKLYFADDESDAEGAQSAFTTLVYKDNVNALISMETSAARNAGLPIVNRAKVPYIYTSFFEGHSCSPWLYVDAWVPHQVVGAMVNYFNKQFKPKSYFLIGSDYAFGRGMLDFAKKYT